MIIDESSHIFSGDDLELFFHWFVERLTAPATDETVSYHFCIWENSIQFRGASHTQKRHKILLRIPDVRCWPGLKPSQWNTLEKSVLSFLKGKESCRKQSKQ